ncbi:ras association domain-containing protein 8 isoform X2 [Parasteatoda tepidariorum]|uniref:ras association domain-containing protein 8 isoform X2 n=1 Tax=Parasteatoda tepidariorum TaxID=114398 RepID=UPI00077FCBF2|nr:ras association domain-containing protein 8 isoform X2 [Parasteatoda tepidariorum]
MELKVWVDGIQRVVCGVTDSSTCQDVVYALAHATGQTGRFTLVEKWRNSERLLAPHEQPLKVLTKWGEYANDVHFVMRKSSNEGKQLSSSNNQTQNNKRQHDFLRSFSPSSGNGNNKQKIPLNNKEIKKSLTFSCGHGSSGSVSSENSTPPIITECAQSNCETSTNRNAKNRESRSKQDLPKGVVRGIPQKPRDSESPNSIDSKIERPKYPPSYDEAVSRSSVRFPSSHLTFAAPSTSQDDESPSSKRPHLANRTDQFTPIDRGSPTSQSQIPRQTNNYRSPLKVEQSLDFIAKSPDRTSAANERLSLSPSRAKSPSKSPDKIIQTNHIDDSLKSKKVTPSKVENEKRISLENKNTPRKTSSQSDDTNRDPQYQDLLRLVSLQREKLDNQQSEITQFDAEVIYWEGKLQEQEEKLSLLQEEVCHLERTHHEQEGELIQLDRRSFSEEVDLGRQEERTLRSELTLARSQLANCETELLQCRQRIRLLLEEIAEERRVKSIREEQDKKEHEEQERHLQTQIECVQKQLNDKVEESDAQNTTEQVKEELQMLEAKLTDKQREMEKLMEEIRDANLRSLSLIPAEEGKFIAEGNFYNRPGSTRKIIGSPRQLENAVPTNKNPHGVWV